MSADTRPLLPSDRIESAALSSIQSFHRATVDEVAHAVERDRVVVIGMRQNPVVRRARAALGAAGIQYRYLEYGSYLSAWKQRLAIKLWSGWPTFPQVFVQGQLIGGAEELDAAVAEGRVKAS